MGTWFQRYWKVRALVRGTGAYHVLRDFGELWSTFSGAQFFDSGYLGHFLSYGDEIWHVRGLTN